MEDDQYIVSSTLRVLPFVKPVIEEIIQRRSRIESHGNAVFTLMILKRFESHTFFTDNFLKQSVISACMRSVCSRSPGLPPKPVKYIDHIVQDAIIDAQTIIISSMTHFDDDTGLSAPNCIWRVK